jgi:hypothetical protein
LFQGPVSNPTPTDGNSTICPTGLTLTWDAGDRADDTNGHEVFFGTSFDDVNEMTDPCAIKNLGDETYDTGWLEYGQTYFWRVDEVNIADACTWRGPIWRFSTYSGRAGDESPRNNRRGLPPGAIDLRWTLPCWLTGQTLYYGTDFPQTIVLFEDDFETGSFDPNWSVYTGWSIYDANDDSNFAPRDDENYLALATAGTTATLTSIDIDTSDYANSINVSFAMLLDKGGK